jgi:hypothetical protein
MASYSVCSALCLSVVLRETSEDGGSSPLSALYFFSSHAAWNHHPVPSHNVEIWKNNTWRSVSPFVSFDFILIFVPYSNVISFIVFVFAVPVRNTYVSLTSSQVRIPLPWKWLRNRRFIKAISRIFLSPALKNLHLPRIARICVFSIFPQKQWHSPTQYKVKILISIDGATRDQILGVSTLFGS